jgi:glycerol-3-phosphate dehydrogenase
MPIAEAVCAVLFDRVDPGEAARALMEREMKQELGE